MPLKKAKFVSAKNYLVTAEMEKTKFTQNKNTGQMTGRTTKAKGTDGTRNLRARNDIEIDGKPGISDNDFHAGQILGRMKKGESKPDRIEVTSHYKKVNGKQVFIGHHIRKIHK